MGVDVDVPALVDFAEARGGRVVVLDGSALAAAEDVFDCYAATFEFPGYFGRNWNAFDECLTTPSGRPTAIHLTVITGAEDLLVDAPHELEVFVRLLDEAGRSWSRMLGLGPEWGAGVVAFNTVLVCTSSDGAEQLLNARSSENPGPTS
ncbi:barstar family protein [Rhodococcus gannanensis]|uniref:Barstar family protein n=1 Tax=Rhodococcus gannanensis TaxID=1960308 RepID=A0ABW4NZY2_9NOCA